jgi:hypothetical protein
MVWKSVLFHENPFDCNPVLRFAEKPRLDELVACLPLMLWFLDAGHRKLNRLFRSLLSCGI